MFQIKKTLSISAAFILCAQFFLACTESNPPFPAEAIADSQPTQVEATKPDSTQKELTKPDSTAKDSTEFQTKSNKGTGIQTTIMNDSTGLLIYSDLYLDYPADSFLTEFNYGDIVTVAIDGYDTLEMPVVETSSG